MRSVWKGLIVGGLTGALAGAAVDLSESGSRSLGAAGRKARRYAPVAAEKVKDAAASGIDLVGAAVNRGVEHLEDANLPERAGEVAGAFGDKVAQAKIPERAADATDRAASAAGNKARAVSSAARKAG